MLYEDLRFNVGNNAVCLVNVKLEPREIQKSEPNQMYDSIDPLNKTWIMYTQTSLSLDPLDTGPTLLCNFKGT